SNDSGLFRDEPFEGGLPLYEAKMIHQFDHRWATYELDADGAVSSRDVTNAEKQDSSFAVRPRYWVDRAEVMRRVSDKNASRWFLGWRDITNATNERTVIASVIQEAGVGNNMPLLFADRAFAKELCLLLGNLGALVLDYTARFKVGGTHLNFFIFKQLPILPPS